MPGITVVQRTLGNVAPKDGVVEVKIGVKRDAEGNAEIYYGAPDVGVSYWPESPKGKISLPGKKTNPQVVTSETKIGGTNYAVQEVELKVVVRYVVRDLDAGQDVDAVNIIAPGADPGIIITK